MTEEQYWAAKKIMDERSKIYDSIHKIDLAEKYGSKKITFDLYIGGTKKDYKEPFMQMPISEMLIIRDRLKEKIKELEIKLEKI